MGLSDITAGHGSTAAACIALLLCAAAAVALWNVERRRIRTARIALRAALDADPGVPFETLLDDIRALADLRGRAAQVHSVTGLPTREPLAARMRADGAGTLAIFALPDVNRLSAFDPVLGEAVLRMLADRLMTMLGTRRFAAQVDRTHLAVWLPGEAAAASVEIDALRYAMSDRLTAGGRDIMPDIGLRTAQFGADHDLPEMIVTRTIAAFSAPDLPDDALPIDLEIIARERYRLEQGLRQAVARGELTLVYQPLVDTGAGCVVGAEALMRWHHPERGLISPAQFIPIMEAAGLATEIGSWALNTAMRQVAGWRRARLGRLRIAVNVSGRQLEAQDLDRLVARTLARHSVGADALEIELTESVALGDESGGRATFDALRAMGVRIAIDDFGTGYSSFSTLRTLAFDKIKIDREFVSGVEASRERQAICSSILALGRGLGIRVLAEGVERAEEVAWLHANGCRHFQGYYFAAPLDADGFAAFVRDRRTLAARLAATIDRRTSQNRMTA